MVSQIMAAQRSLSNDAFRMGVPELVSLSEKPPISKNGQLIFDHSFPEAIDDRITIRFGQPLSLIGWMIMEIANQPYRWDRVAYIVLTANNSGSSVYYHVPITNGGPGEILAYIIS